MFSMIEFAATRTSACGNQVDDLPKTADNHALMAEMGGLLHSGLRSLHVVSGTGAGRSAIRQSSRAADIIRTAIANQVAILTAPQRRDLDSWVAGSKVGAGPTRLRKSCYGFVS